MKLIGKSVIGGGKIVMLVQRDFAVLNAKDSILDLRNFSYQL